MLIDLDDPLVVGVSAVEREAAGWLPEAHTVGRAQRLLGAAAIATVIEHWTRRSSELLRDQLLARE